MAFYNLIDFYTSLLKKHSFNLSSDVLGKIADLRSFLLTTAQPEQMIPYLIQYRGGGPLKFPTKEDLLIHYLSHTSSKKLAETIRVVDQHAAQIKRVYGPETLEKLTICLDQKVASSAV